MTAYNKSDIEAYEINSQSESWFHKKLINEETYQSIKSSYQNTLYSPGIFIRIGLFIFTLILACAALGLFFLISGYSGGEVYAGLRIIVFAAAGFYALYSFIQNKKVFRSGIDEALAYFSAGSLITGIFLTFGELIEGSNHEELILYLISLPVLIFIAIYYIDRLATLAAYACFIAIVFELFLQLGEIGKAILPFIIIVISAIVYLIIRKTERIKSLHFWKDCIYIIEICSLATFYLAGNYFVVRELSITLLGFGLQPGKDIPLAIFFYIFTAIIPVIYILFGLKLKDRILLQVGLIFIAISVLTFKYYFSLGHHEITLTIAGVIMILFAYFSIQYLKKPNTYGLTYLKEEDEDYFLGLNAEAMIIAQNFSPKVESSEGFEFGGGNFGGGGASGQF